MASAWSTARWCGWRGPPPRRAWPTSSGTPPSGTRVPAHVSAPVGAARSGRRRRGCRDPARRGARRCRALVPDLRDLSLPGRTAGGDPRLVRSRRRRPAAVAHAPVRSLGPRTAAGPTPRGAPAAAATAAFLAVLALSAVQINIYFGLNHTVGDLTGTAVARIQPLEAGLTRAAGGPAATGLAQWHGARRPSRRRHPQGGHPRHGLRLPEPGRLRLPSAGLPEFPPARAAGAGPVFRPAGRPRRLADRRRAPEPAGPVRRGARRGGAGGGSGRSQRLGVGQHAVHGQQDCPGGHLPGPGRAGLDQPHARRRPGSAALGRGRLLLRRHVRHADGDQASRRLQRGAGVLQREGAGPREGARRRPSRPPSAATPRPSTG